MFNLIKNIFHKQFASDVELIALSNSQNGYEREKAIRRMMEKPNSIFIENLLIRVNDWVPQVRNLAKQAIRDLLVEANTDAFITLLDKIAQLSKKGRCDHSDLIREIYQFILSKDNETKLIQNVKSSPGELARVSYELLSQKMPPTDLIQLAVASKDVVLIKRSSSLIGHLNDDDFDKIFPTLINSKYSYPRCVALQIGMKKFPERITNSCVQMLIDNSADVRLVSINFFKNNGFNVEEFYLKQLTASKTSKVKVNVLLGLAQAKCVDCIEVVRTYLNFKLVVVREAALRTLFSLSPNDSFEVLFNAILDDSPRVSKTAVILIAKSEKKLTFDDFLRWLELAKKDHSIKGLLRLAHNLNKWEELILILKFFKSSNSIYQPALVEWTNKFNGRQTLPTSEQISEIRNLIRTDVFDNEQWVQLKFTLKPFQAC